MEKFSFEDKGYVEYETKEGKPFVVHTVVYPEFGGQGVASRMLTAFQEQFGSFNASCSYAQKWLEKQN